MAKKRDHGSSEKSSARPPLDVPSNGIENAIRQAMEAGHFEHLPGKGKPLDLSRNPHERQEDWLVNKMLRDADVLPPWLEERRRLLEELDRMRKAWLRSWRRSTESSRRRQLKRQIENDLADLNRRILSYNIKAPHLNFHLRALRPADEWARLSEA